MNEPFIHPTAIVEEGVKLGQDVKIWHHSHVRRGVTLADKVSLGKDVFIDAEVTIGLGSRIQNGVSIYKGVMIQDWVFVGPNVTFTNDRIPRAGTKDWKISTTILNPGCSIGAGATIISDISIGAFAMVGAGSVLTESIPAFHLVHGLPAKLISQICACGSTRFPLNERGEVIRVCCEQRLLPETLKVAKEEAEKRKIKL